MHDFILNIDNKEILNELLHHSVDYLIGSCKDNSAIIVKSSHKYGFANPDDFESAIKTIATTYKLHCLESLSEVELQSKFALTNPDLQKAIVDVFKARKPEIAAFLVRQHNSTHNSLLESFDWDLRFIMGDSSLSTHKRQIATVALNCLEPNGSHRTVHFEMNLEKLDKFIKVLEDCDKSLPEVDLSQVSSVSQSTKDSSAPNTSEKT